LYAIKMNNDKSLVTTVHAMIYQNECNADTLVFVIPKTYDNIEMANCSMLMRYILPDGVGKSEEIEMDPIPYNSEYYVYRLKAGSRFTKIAGKIELWLSAIDVHDNCVFKTSSLYIIITPTKNICDCMSEEDKDQLNALSVKVQRLEAEKADDITFHEEDSTIQLLSGVAPIGRKINMADLVAKLDTDDEIIHFGDSEADDGTDEDPDAVIRF